MVIRVIPYFIFSLILWILNTEVPSAKYSPFNQAEYLTIMGIVKYSPVLLFSVLASHFISNNLSKKLIAFLTLIASSIAIGLQFVPIESFGYLALLLLFIFFSLVYEPMFDILAAHYGEMSKNYLYVNSSITLTRTSARFVGPLLLIYVLFGFFEFNLYQIVSYLLLLCCCAVLFVDFPHHQEDKSQRKKRTIVGSLKKVFSSRVSLSLYAIFCVFYLGINYLEYLITIADRNHSVDLAEIISGMGAGFVTANILLLVFNKKINHNRIFLLSLIISGCSLISFPFCDGLTVFIPIFLIGFGNGLAVSISAAIIQQILKTELIGHFAGVLDSSINFCALVSMGIGYLIISYLDYKIVFVADGLFVLISALIWFLTDKKEIENV